MKYDYEIFYTRRYRTVELYIIIHDIVTYG